MSANAIVVSLNIFKDSLLGLPSGCEMITVNSLLFQCGKERLCHHVIPSIAVPTHAVNRLAVLKDFPECV